MINKDLLTALASEYGVRVDETAAEKLDIYARLLVEWNNKMNLTAITAPEDMVLKHFVDSLTALPLLPAHPFSLIDVGTGAGFPGIPLCVVRPDIRLTLLDSLNKRLLFLKEVCTALEIPADLIHARAEEGGHRPDLREQFDIAAARAVAPLPVLTEYCLPFVRPGGQFLAMKGPEGRQELRAAEQAIALLGGRTAAIEEVSLPLHPAPGQEVSTRVLILIDKISSTSSRFPRPSAKIAKHPL